VQHRLSAPLILAAGVALAACQNTPATFGATPLAAHANADDLCIALQERFTHAARTPELITSIDRITHNALAPGQLYDDSTLWTSTDPDSSRLLLVQGTYAGDHYTFTPRPEVPTPEHLGDARHEIRLRLLGHGDYAWYAAVSNAIGSISATDIARITSSILSASAATQNDHDLMTGAGATFPHTATALGRLLTLDSLSRTPLDDHTARIRLVVNIHPDDLAAIYPHFASYITHYIADIRARATAVDSSGTPWIDLQIDRTTYTLSIRSTADGHFAPLSGPARPIPDSLTLHGEMTTKISIFTVGFSELVGTFYPIQTAHERAWGFRFQNEPHWHFPLAVDHLIKTPLRRPFAGDGTQFRIGFSDSTGAQTQLARETHLEMHESAIMRWIGGLAGNAIGGYSGRVSAEGDAFFADAFNGLRMVLDK